MGVRPGDIVTKSGRMIRFSEAKETSKRLAKLLDDVEYIAPEAIERRMITVARAAILINSLAIDLVLAEVPPVQDPSRVRACGTFKIDDRDAHERAQDLQLDVDLEILKLARKVGALWRKQYESRKADPMQITPKESEWHSLLEPLAELTK